MTGLRDLRVGMQLAVGTLSIIPVGPLPSLTVPIARWAMILAPVAAIPLGVGAALAGSAGHLAHLPSLVTAGLVLAFLGWATRAMHWDGLADTADGLAVSWDRERALDIMRRGDAGPVAVGVLGLVLLVDTAALAAVLELPGAPSSPVPWWWRLAGHVRSPPAGGQVRHAPTGLGSPWPAPCRSRGRWSSWGQSGCSSSSPASSPVSPRGSAASPSWRPLQPCSRSSGAAAAASAG